MKYHLHIKSHTDAPDYTDSIDAENKEDAIELAKKMKELSAPQESLFWWGGFGKWDGGIFIKTKLGIRFGKYGDGFDPECPAYTVAELGEMLPDDCSFVKGHNAYNEPIWAADSEYFDIGHEANTEADARAAMWIYLKENNLLTP